MNKHTSAKDNRSALRHIKSFSALSTATIWTRGKRLAIVSAFTPYNVLFATLLIVHLLPLWLFEYFPSQDGPSHLYNANIIRNYGRQQVDLFREFYTLEHRFGVNWLIHLTLAGLMEFFSELTAEKIFLSGYAVFFMLALRYAVLSISRASLPIAFLGFPLIYTRSMHMGFYSFGFSVAVFLVCVGYWAKQTEMGIDRKLVLLAAISILLYLTHVLSLFMAIVAIATVIVWFVFLDIISNILSSPNVEFSWRSVWYHSKVSAMLAFAPSIFLFLLFLLHGQSYDSPVRTLKLALREFISFQRIEAAVSAGLGILFLLLICSLKDKLTRLRVQRGDGFLLAGLVALMVYVVSPDEAFGGGHIRVRLIIYPTLLLILWLATQNYGRHVKKVVAGGASVLAIAALLIRAPQYHQFNEYIHDYVSAGDFIDPRTTVLPISFPPRASRDFDWFTRTSPNPLFHASGYIATRKTLIDLGDYQAITDLFPTAFRGERNPRHYIGNRERAYSRLDISTYYNNTGKHLDYILVWSGTGVDGDLGRAADLRKQLDDNYAVLYTSPLGLTRLYRRRDYNK